MKLDRKVELLAPAGDLECIKAAINAGADAVYTGGDKFGARAYANNLNKDELIEAINYAHIHEAFLYLTVNTLLKDDEIKKDLYDYIKPLYDAGLDAVIVQDMGVFKFIKENFDDLDIHVSTQSTINGRRTAKRFKELGASRVVMPREMSLESIKDIKDYADVEIESFVHGALCYCYSGMCLLSSIIGGRSGNRGKCAQPCRKEYDIDGKKCFILSTKDMCTIKILPEIIKSGVYSLKIEGRMKKPTYVSGVVSIYRKYLDFYLENKHDIDSGKIKYIVKDEDYNNLLDLFNRNGFNESYYKIHCDKSMMSLEKPKFRSENKGLVEYLNNNFIDNKKRETINIDITIKKDKPIKVKSELFRKYEDNIIVEFESITADKAINRELETDEVKKQLSKLGNTLYIANNINVNLDNGLFLSVGNLKQIKREIVEKTDEAVIEKYKPTYYQNDTKVKQNIITKEKENTKFKVLINNFNQLKNVIKSDYCLDIYVEDFIFENISDFYKELNKAHNANKKVYYSCIRFLHFEKEDVFKKSIIDLLDNNIDGFLVRSYEEYFIIKEIQNNRCNENFKNIDIIFDNTIYTFNTYSFEFINDFINAKEDDVVFTYPFELKFEQLKHLKNNANKEIVIYGKMPVMVSANCVIRNSKGCTKKNEKTYIKDDLNNKFFIATNCRYCQNTIYNCVPTSLYGVYDKVSLIDFDSVRLDFTDESDKEVCDIIKYYYDLVNNNLINKDVFFEQNNFTRGHFIRGVK